MVIQDVVGKEGTFYRVRLFCDKKLEVVGGNRKRDCKVMITQKSSLGRWKLSLNEFRIIFGVILKQ